MQSPYLLRIVYRDSPDTVVTLEPGLSAERELVEDIVAQLADRPVGMFRTRARVEQEVRGAVEDALLALKARVAPR